MSELPLDPPPSHPWAAQIAEIDRLLDAYRVNDAIRIYRGLVDASFTEANAVLRARYAVRRTPSPPPRVPDPRLYERCTATPTDLPVLRRPLRRLSAEPWVWARCGPASGADRLIDQIALLLDEVGAEFPPHYGDQPPIDEVAASLGAWPPAEAPFLLAAVATRSMYWPSYESPHLAAARTAAAAVCDLMGPRAVWFSNIGRDRPWREHVAALDAGYGPVTGHTFSGLVAGADERHLVVVLQAQED